VSNLVWLANFGTFVALASYSRQKAASHNEPNVRAGADYNVKFGAMTQTVFSMALTIYMWSKADTFGNMPECSHLVNYIIFAIKVPVLGAGKIIGLTASSILTAAYVLITLHELRSYRRSRKECGGRIDSLPPTSPRSPKAMSSATSVPTGSNDFPLLGPIIPTSYHQHTQTQAPPQYPKESLSHVPNVTRKRRPRRRRWSYEVDPMLIGITICQIIVFTYFIVSTELLLSYNQGSSSAQQLGFGQILALIVVLPSALSVVGALKKHGLKRLSKRKKKNVRRNQRRTSNVTENV